jgi:hypothetical protein
VLVCETLTWMRYAHAYRCLCVLKEDELSDRAFAEHESVGGMTIPSSKVVVIVCRERDVR